MPNVGPMEIVLLLGLALLLFGAKRLPEIGRSVGHGIREFKGSISGETQSHLELEPPVAEAVRETPSVTVVRDHDSA